MMSDKVGEKMSESSGKPSQGGAGQDNSERNAAEMPEKMNEFERQALAWLQGPAPARHGQQVRSRLGRAGVGML